MTARMHPLFVELFIDRPDNPQDDRDARHARRARARRAKQKAQTVRRQVKPRPVRKYVDEPDPCQTST